MKHSNSQILFCVSLKLIDGITILFLSLMLSFFLLPKLGFSFERVLSDSMSPSITRADLVVLDQYDRQPEVGEVAAFEQEGLRILHRIIGMEKIQRGEHPNGEEKKAAEAYVYKTKGDANGAPDSFPVTQEMIRGTMITVIPKGRYFADFMNSGCLIPAAVLLCLLQGLTSVNRSVKKNFIKEH